MRLGWCGGSKTSRVWLPVIITGHNDDVSQPKASERRLGIAGPIADHFFDDLAAISLEDAATLDALAE